MRKIIVKKKKKKYFTVLVLFSVKVLVSPFKGLIKGNGIGFSSKPVWGRDILVVNCWFMLHLQTLLSMWLGILQKEGRPFKSLVIISTNEVHVFLYNNEQHIGVCGESENTE
jgi:hypothetical protein